MQLACAELFSDAEASALAGEAVAAVADASLLTGVSAIAARQGGVLECAWSAGGQPEPYFGSPLYVSIISNAEQDFAASRPSPNPACSVATDNSYCATGQLVNGYWMAAQLSSRTVGTNSGLTVESIAASWDAAIQKIVGLIEGAGQPLDPWVAPAGTFTGAFCDSHDPGQAYVPQSPVAAAAARVARSCGVGNEWYVSIVPGGAWALPIMAQTLPPADKEVGNWTPFDVPGAEVALRACGEYCMAIISVGGSAVSVSTGTYIDYVPMPPDAIPFDDAARSILAEILAAG